MKPAALRAAPTALAAAAIASFSACASGWQDPAPRLLHYHCQLALEGPFGTLSVNATLSRDRRRVRYYRSWSAELEQGRLSVRSDWSGLSDAPPPAHAALVILRFPRERRAWSRFQMRRNAADGPLVYSTSPFNPPHRWAEEISWRRLSAAFGDAQALHVALVRRNGAVIAQALLPRAILEAPREASAALRLQLDERLANPADHCWARTDPLVIA